MFVLCEMDKGEVRSPAHGMGGLTSGGMTTLVSPAGFLFNIAPSGDSITNWLITDRGCFCNRHPSRPATRLIAYADLRAF